MKVALFFVCALLPAAAQTGPGPVRWFDFAPELQRYLELTPEQVNTLGRRNAALAEFNGEKYRRIAQVQLEIAEETQKTQLDAMALGLRYLELEAIRRELRAEADKAYVDIQAILTPAQKTKVQALVEALRLQPVICQAQAVNILPSAVPTGVTGALLSPYPIQTGFASFLLGGAGTSGCAGGFGFPTAFRPLAGSEPAR